MRLKWYGVLLLLFDLYLAPLRNYIYSPISIDIIVGMIMIVGLVLIIVDCRKDDKEYVEKIQKQIKGES